MSNRRIVLPYVFDPGLSRSPQTTFEDKTIGFHELGHICKDAFFLNELCRSKHFLKDVLLYLTKLRS